MKKVKVLVTGIGGGGHGEQILKALRMSTLPLEIVGADMTIYSKSRSIVDEFFVLPPASHDNYIEVLISECVSRGVEILFHGSEPELKKMSINRKKIADAGIFLPINSEDVIETCMDKYKTIEFLKENNFCFPESYKITSMQDVNFVNKYPVVLKPSIGGGGSANTMIAQSKDELIVFTKYLFNTYDEFIAQEYVGTPYSEYTVGILHDMDGKLINSIAVKRMILSSLGNRIKIKNMTSNKSLGDVLVISSGISQGEIGKYAEVTAQCEEIASKLNSRGPINIQCRFVDNKVYIFEINPRYSGTSSMRAIVGMNEPELMIKYHYFKENIERNFDFKEGYVLRGLEETYLPYN
jgi:carbamoyl-phosphate synthase large subunit